MKNNVKTLLLSFLVIAVCAVVVVVTVLVMLGGNTTGTHVVIEKSETETVHGELDIKLVRERLESITLNQSGVNHYSNSEEEKDFSFSQENIFGIDGNVLVAPSCYFSAHVAISNTKPYAFEYWLEIVPVSGDSLLAEQLELTVTIDGEHFINRTLQSGLTTKVFPKVEIGQTAKFIVKLEYLDTVNNDQTKNTSLAFDMVVHARLT